MAAELAAFVDRWGEGARPRALHGRAQQLKLIKSIASAARAIHVLQSYELRVARCMRQYSADPSFLRLHGEELNG